MTGSPLAFHLIFHTHWDREWYRSRSAFLPRLVRLLDDLIPRLEHEPRFRAFHLDGQTILLDDYLAVRPAMARRVAALVARGALRTGPWYVLADEQIPSAAAIRWNLRLGRAFLDRHGTATQVCYAPDAFGHPDSLPGLAVDHGLDAAVIWRGAAMPRDLFWWEDPSRPGVRLLTYQLPAAGYESGAALPADPAQCRQAWLPIRTELAARAACRQIAVFIGADHHLAHPNPVGLVETLQRLEPEHRVVISTLDEFFAAVREEAPDLPVVRGALRAAGRHTWVLQGVLGTRSRLKRRNAALELALDRYVEPLVRGNGTNDGALVEEAWKTVIASHFHDTLAGTCADAVAEEMATRLRQVEDLSAELARARLWDLAGYDPDQAADDVQRESPALLLWNPRTTPLAGEGEIVQATILVARDRIPIGPGTTVPTSALTSRPATLLWTPILDDGNDRRMPAQVLAVTRGIDRLDPYRRYPQAWVTDRIRVAFRAPALGAQDVTRLHVHRGMADGGPAGGVRVEGEGRETLLRNGVVAATIEEDGTIALTTPSGVRTPGLARLLIEADLGDTYSYAPASNGGPLRCSAGPLTRTVLAAGPLTGALAASWTVTIPGHGRLEVRALVTLDEGDGFVRLRYEIVNQAVNVRVRLAFPTGATSGVEALAGGQTAAAWIPPGRLDRHAMEWTTPTIPVHRYLAAADPHRGLMLGATGFFEGEWTRECQIVLTAFRSIGHLSKGGLPSRPGHAGWPTPTPGAQEWGAHRVVLALAPLTTQELDPSVLETFWERMFVTPLVCSLLGSMD